MTSTTGTADLAVVELSAPVSVRVAGDDFEVAASAAQERIWFASQLSSDAALYHVYDEIPLGRLLDDTGDRPADGTASPAALQEAGTLVAGALATVVARHEALRTTVHRRDDGGLVQRVTTALTAPLAVWDLGGLAEAARERELHERLATMLATPIDVTRAPLWRAALVRLADDDWRCMMSVHHAVTDGASLLVVRGELTELVAAARGRRPAALPQIGLQYADYAEWQRSGMDDTLDELDAFWDGYLADLPAVHRIPLDLPRPAERSFAAADVYRTLPATTAAAVTRFATEHRSSDFMVLCTAFLAVVRRWSGADDLVVGLPVTGRDRPELDRVVGMFVNMVVLRVDASGDPTFAELLSRTRAGVLEVLEHQQMPFQRLVGRHATRAGAGVPPLYQLGFNHLAMRQRASVTSAEDDLGCEIGVDEHGRLGIRIEYTTDLFLPATADALAQDLAATVTAALADPGLRVSQLPLVSGRRAPDAAAPADATDATAATDASGEGSTSDDGPLSPTEELVAATWQELLPPVGRPLVRRDEFFACGGHSLLALRVIARLREAAGVDLPIGDFFTDTTIGGVGAALERAMIAEIAALSDDETRALLAEDGRA